MKAQDFFELTKQTRARQKAWFDGKRLSDLFEAKRLERLLDAAIREGLDPETPLAEQLALFDQQENNDE